MPLPGTVIRMQRIFPRREDKLLRTVIVPMDHGLSSGPIPGLEDMRDAKQRVADGGANAVITQKGWTENCLRKSGPDMAFIAHASASTGLSDYPNQKVLVCTVDEALQMAADAISVHINIGNGYDGETMRDCSALIRSAKSWGMPVLAMMYPRGEKISKEEEYDVKNVMHAARVGVELGADVIKCSYTGSPESFREVVKACGGVPVVIAGGPKMDSDQDLLEMVWSSIQAGAAGTSIGRNIFQHENPTAMVKAIASIVHENKSVEEARQFLNK